MKRTKHTPGPWKVRVNEGASQRAGFSLYEINNIRDYDEMPKVEDEANAHLIAAAPELLERLKECAALINSGLDRGQYNIAAETLYEECIEAIAKAEGRE